MLFYITMTHPSRMGEQLALQRIAPPLFRAWLPIRRRLTRLGLAPFRQKMAPLDPEEEALFPTMLVYSMRPAAPL